MYKVMTLSAIVLAIALLMAMSVPSIQPQVAAVTQTLQPIMDVLKGLMGKLGIL